MEQRIDIHNYDRQYEKTIINVREAKIPKESKELIFQFAEDSFNNLGKPRRIKYLSTLKQIAGKLKDEQRKVVSFDKATIKDLKRFVAEIDDRGDYSVWTKQSYKVVIKRFYKWYKKCEEGYPKEVSWIKTTIKKKDRTFLDPNDILTDEEIGLIIKTAKNQRDKAFYALLGETGMRMGEITSLVIKSVKFTKTGADVTIKYSKSKSRILPLFKCVPELSKWINNHPLRDNLTAPLWVNIGNRNRDAQLDYRNFWYNLKKIAKEAGIKKRVFGHLYRHSVATKLSGILSQYELCMWMGWELSSDMPQTYIHQNGDELRRKMNEHYGIKEQELIKVREPIICPRCKANNPPDNLKCFSCNMDFNTADSEIKKKKEVSELINKLFDKPEIVKALRNVLDKDEKMVDKMRSLV